MIPKIKNKTLLMGIVSAVGLCIYSPQVWADNSVNGVSAMQQSRTTVTGRVTDSTGPLIGATVMERGTKNGAVTDMDGNFSLDVQDDATLVVSYVGYTQQEVATAGRTVVNVQLVEEGTSLGDVVVIGYGTQRKEAVTGSVASMRGDDLRQVQTGDVTQALQGRIAGVNLTQTNSQPGAPMQIRIRGTRSLNASNEPLIVLDGIPFSGSISDIDPNVIRSMDILKDASATAIYGSRGANGVILITTVSGTTATKPTVSYSGYVGFKSAVKFPMMNGPQFAQLRKDIQEVGGNLQAASPDEVAGEEAGVSTDWQGLLFRTGITTSHDINVSKSSEDGNYAFGGSYLLDQSPVPTQQYSRLGLHANINQNLGKWVKVGLSTNDSYGKINGNQFSLGSVLSSSPLASPYNDDGTLRQSITTGPSNRYPVITRQKMEDWKDTWLGQSKQFASYNSLYAEITQPWVSGLKYRINVGLNARLVNGGGFTGIGVNNIDPNSTNSASVSHQVTTDWTVENILSYNHTFAEKHNLDVTALYSAEQTSMNQDAFNATNFPSDQFQYFDFSKAIGTIVAPGSNQMYQVSGLMSWMGRVMYSYDDKYMISATVRADASSRLAPGHKWHTYPAVSAGWNINKEAFMRDVKWVNALKVRVGYGETSNQAINPYQTLGLLGVKYYNFGPTGYYQGLTLSQMANSELGWEYTKTWNFGVDFSLFNNRLTGTAEYYSQHTNGLLYNVALPQTAGVGSYMGNIGESSNKGFELSLNGTILDNVNGWTWDVGVNFATNQNRLLSLASGETQDLGNYWFVGHSINSIYDYQKLGLWNESDTDYKNGNFAIMEPGGNLGMIKVKYTGGYNDDGTAKRSVNSDDRQIMSVDPSWTGGFNTRVAYKGVDLTVVGVFQHGGTLISSLYGGSSYLNLLTGRQNNVNVDYWMPDNTGAKYPRPGGINSSDNQKYASTMAYFSASYLKIGTITLGYNFPKSVLKVLGNIQSLRVYATAQNPFTLFSPYHDETGLDPQANAIGNQTNYQATTVGTLTFNGNLPVVGYNTPSTRNYLLGLNITF